MSDSYNSFNTMQNPKDTSTEQSNNYFMDFSQFAGEWQEPASRSTNQERGAKVAKSAGFTLSFGKSSLGDHPYTVTETAKSLDSADDTVAPPQAAKPETADNTTMESQESPLESKEPNLGAEVTQPKTGPVDISELWPPQVVETDIPKKSTPEEESIGRHFADDPESNFRKSWTRGSNYIGKHFADESSPTAERRWQNESSNIEGKHFADESEIRYGRYTREKPSAKGKRFRKEEPKAKGGRHFAEEADWKEGSRESRDSDGEAGKHFRVEQERNNLLKNILNKIKKSKGFRAVVSVVLAGVIAFSAAGNFSQSNQAHAMGADDFEEAVQQTAKYEEPGSSGETEQQHNILTGYEALDELIDGSFEQDDNPGCYEANGKVSDNAVGNPNEVLELMNIDSANATAEDYGKVSEYMAYSMKYPAAYIAVANDFEGFQGLTTNQAEQKIASMSDAEKQNFQDELKDTFGHTTYSLKSANGAYRDYGVTGEGAGRHSYFVETNFNNTMLLEAKTVDANGNMTITYSKADCDNPVDFIVQYNSTTNNYEAQLINTTESDTDNPSTSETSDDTNPSDTPETSDEDPTEPDNPGTEVDDSKDADAIRRNMNYQDRITPMGPGELSERPDTSRDSYQEELDYAQQQKEEARNAQSESENGGTVGDIIDNADTTYADHENYTENQRRDQEQEADARIAQEEADAAADQMKTEAEQNAGMSDDEAAEWFNSTISQGGSN